MVSSCDCNGIIIYFFQKNNFLKIPISDLRGA